MFYTMKLDAGSSVMDVAQLEESQLDRTVRNLRAVWKFLIHFLTQQEHRNDYFTR